MKGAVHSFTTVLAKEVGQHGIRVNAVAPYATFAKSADAFSSGSRFHPDNAFFAKSAGTISDADRAMRQRRTLVGRPFAVPEEISGLVAHLASDRAGFVTRSEEHTSELQSLMRISYAVFCLKKKKHTRQNRHTHTRTQLYTM